MSSPKQLPETRPLSEILPKGREGGLQFARIVDLLLFYDARRRGRNLTLFSDRAGDYRGLDSFADTDLRLDGLIGYQYKFFPSPLNTAHRKAIIDALVKAQEAQKEQKNRAKLQKWILVTPDDLTESAQRKTGGDVAWFSGLRSRLNLDFKVEHWGHRKLQGLFLETPPLCLFYYPELIPEGSFRRRSIEETRLGYDKNLHALYGRIEFVGMSVYKPEATRGVPMEHIYIPLTTVGEQADDRNETTPRARPQALLHPPGGHHVILGDPGSGKSTLLKFLTLAGASEPLQKRYDMQPDRRLPVLVILRRYADALKAKPDLALFDYVLGNLRADLSLPHVDAAFLEYYLESGQALLLFDGMDELPNPQFKQTVRNRIHCFLNTYPGNTAIITSRVVGYENPYRFDEQGYRHHKLARLALPEMEQFVADWYAVRVENLAERRANVEDLTRILRDTRHQAIGELAANPLLLTIIALVHRIDAVLPDERVVLYQKCTETLLNTWHNWKYRATEAQERRGKIERRNRRRIEALAHWMHDLAGGTRADQRAVVPYDQARDFLTAHIREQEHPGDPDDAQDLAEDFLEFVKSRAGLLLEVGDRLYSFVHLTFQEYLTATHLAARMELGGAESLWKEISCRVPDPRWHEVIRLLVAGLRSGDSQAYLVERLLELTGGTLTALLLGGLLLDGIEAAEREAATIARRLFESCVSEAEPEWIGRLVALLKALLLRPLDEEGWLEEGFSGAWEEASAKDRHALILAALAAGIGEERLAGLTGSALVHVGFEWERLLLAEMPDQEPSREVRKRMADFYDVLALWASRNPWTNRLAALAEAVLAPGSMSYLSFDLRLFVLLHLDRGPFLNFGIHPAWARLMKIFVQIPPEHENRASYGHLTRTLDKSLFRALHRYRTRDQVDRARDRALYRARVRVLDRVPDRFRHRDRDRDRDRYRELDGTIARALAQNQPSDTIWRTLLSDSELTEDLTVLIADGLSLEPRGLWQEALQTCFLPRIPQRLWLYKPESREHVEACFEAGSADENDVYAAAWMLLFDLWLYATQAYDDPAASPYARLADLTRHVDSPPPAARPLPARPGPRRCQPCRRLESHGGIRRPRLPTDVPRRDVGRLIGAVK